LVNVPFRGTRSGNAGPGGNSKFNYFRTGPKTNQKPRFLTIGLMIERTGNIWCNAEASFGIDGQRMVDVGDAEALEMLATLPARGGDVAAAYVAARAACAVRINGPFAYVTAATAFWGHLDFAGAVRPSRPAGQ
jgi:hypothetical protein